MDYRPRLAVYNRQEKEKSPDAGPGRSRHPDAFAMQHSVLNLNNPFHQKYGIRKRNNYLLKAFTVLLLLREKSSLCLISFRQRQTIKAKADGPRKIAFTLLAASGLRAGEAFGLEVKHFVGNTLSVEQSVWEGRKQTPKTKNARREVDLHPSVATLLRGFIGHRKDGFIFRRGRNAHSSVEFPSSLSTSTPGTTRNRKAGCMRIRATVRW
jgi:integrase